MAHTAANKLPPSGIPIVDALTNGTYWQLGPDRTLTFAIADLPSPDWQWNAAGAAYMAARMGQVLSQYSEVANINFRYGGWYADLRTASADIVLAATLFPFAFDLQGGYARAYFPNEAMSDAATFPVFGNSYPNAAGDLVLNFINGEMFGSDYAPSSNGFFALMHEVGHALGLKHPHDNGGTLGRPTFQQLGVDRIDIQRLTVMSYNPATDLASWLQMFGVPAAVGYPKTLMPLDVLAMQNIYGPNTSTRAGDTTYQLFNDSSIETFWDAGGTDTLTASGSGFGWQIDTISMGTGHQLTYAVPRDWTAMTGKFYFGIERLEGSQWSDEILGANGADSLSGLGGADRLKGRGGNDAINGGAGIDTAFYDGARSGFSVERNGASWQIVDRSGSEGTDTLVSVERVYFSDFSVALDVEAGGHAIQSAQLIRAIFGPAALTNRGAMGVPISLLDGGMSFLDLVSLGVDALRIGAGVRSNSDFVRVLYLNVVGAPAPDDAVAAFVAALDSGQFTQVTLAAAAALDPINVESADLIGLQNSGIEFVHYSG